MTTRSKCQRTVAISGATGFVGFRLLKRHLAMGDKVRILTRQKASDCGVPDLVTVFQGDLRNGSGALLEFVTGVDVLYHCAAELHNASEMYATNVAGTRNLAEAAKHNIGHWVQLSSVAVYGWQPDGIIAENTSPNIGHPFLTTESKLAAEKEAKNCASEGGFTYTILRPCKIYGAGMPDDSIRNLARYINKGLFFFIGRCGAPAHYVHVENVVEALVLCGTCPAARNRAFNLCDEFTIEDLAIAIAHNLGRPQPRFRVPRGLAMWLARFVGGFLPNFPLTEDRVAGLAGRQIYASNAIQELLGYMPVVTLEAGITETIRRSRDVW